MKAINSLRTLPHIALFAILFVLPIITQAQCRTDLLLGQNIVTNGDFSQGYTGWTYTADSDGDLNTGPDGYQVYTASPRTYSIPGNIFVGTGSQMSYFNNSFTAPFNDHSSSSDDKFLMVDGVCVTGIKLWKQTNIPVVPNTRYYFSVWINSLKDQPHYPGILNFDVNGTNLVDLTNKVDTILAPALGGGSVGGAWKRVTAFWDSGPTPPATVTISIEGNQTIGCGGASGESDFAIDDISFVPGCSYGDPGPQPDLGPDQSLCGKGGSITLDANVPHNATTTVTWSDGTTGTGLGAPYTKVINAAGTYSVCVTDGSSCTKADVIVISNTFTPNTSPNADICGTGSSTLDAVFTGLSTTYQWKLNGADISGATNRTYTATAAGTYTVAVTVAGCGTVTSGNTVITSSATAAPTTSAGGDLCKTNPVPLDAVVTGTGITYQWKLNGVNLPAPSTNKTYSAISPGTYTVTVKLPGCTATTSGNTVVTSSSTVTPVDAVYCANAGVPVSVTLGATGTNSANFKWYTASTGGSAVNTGASYTISIPAGTTATQTYYVEDPTVQTGTVGPATEFATGSLSDVYPDNAMTSNAQWGINFSPTQDFTLNSVMVPIRIVNADAMSMTIAITLRVYTSAGVATAYTSTSTNTITIPAANAAAYTLYQFNFSGFTIPLSAGPNLILKIESKTTNYLPWRYNIGNRTGLTSPFSYSSTISPNPVTINSSFSSNSNSTTQYFGLYNWNISAVSPCTRIPVRAINNCVTPVTWTSFYLVPQDNNSCKLVWSTANETNNSYFAIERSVDGINFETIATVSGAGPGTRDIASNYFFMDETPVSGTSYYRITQHDYDGKFSSTAMKPYSSEGVVKVTTYPNPFQNNTTLMVSGADASTYTYTLHSVNGQSVGQGSGTMNQIQTIGDNLSKGMYMLTILTNTESITTKIVKQ